MIIIIRILIKNYESLFEDALYFLDFANTASLYEILTPLQVRMCLFRGFILDSASFFFLKKLFLAKVLLFLFGLFVLFEFILFVIKHILKVAIMHDFICTSLVGYLQLMFQLLLLHNQISNLLFELLLLLLQALNLHLEVSYSYDVPF